MGNSASSVIYAARRVGSCSTATLPHCIVLYTSFTSPFSVFPHQEKQTAPKGGISFYIRGTLEGRALVMPQTLCQEGRCLGLTDIPCTACHCPCADLTGVLPKCTSLFAFLSLCSPGVSRCICKRNAAPASSASLLFICFAKPKPASLDSLLSVSFVPFSQSRLQVCECRGCAEAIVHLRVCLGGMP